MIKNKDISFGNYLKSVRCEKNISLDEVSEKTKITKSILRKIEEENYKKLPAEIYVKGFLRAYAKAVGADDDIVVKKYLSNLPKSEEDIMFIPAKLRFGNFINADVVISLGILIFVFSFSVFVMTVLYDKYSAPRERHYFAAENPKNVKEPIMLSKANDTYNTDATPSKTSENPQNNIEKISLNSSDSEKKEDEKLFLKIKTLEETWIRVVTDGHKSKEYNLKPEDKLELEASAEFYLIIGNAGGIKLALNDKPLPELGKRGQVIKMKIPQK